MPYYALSCVDDAVDATRAFLVPVDRGRWLRLAVVVFFLSGASGVGSFPNVSWNLGPGEVPFDGAPPFDGDFSFDGPPAELFDHFLPLLVGLAIVFAAVGLLFVLIGSVMEFVLVDALRTESVAVRASMREYLGAGVALFLFRVVLGAVVFGLLAGLGLLLVVPVLDAGGAQLAIGVLLMLFAGLVVGIAAALLHGFTTDFVVPTMVHESRGLGSAWRRFWPVLRDNLAQFGVYVVVRFLLTIGVGIVASIVLGVAAVVVGVPFAVVAGVAFLGFGGALTVVSAVVFGLVAAAFVLTLLAVTAVVQVPLKTFTRYYELLVLGDVEPELDLVADRRRAVREE